MATQSAIRNIYMKALSIPFFKLAFLQGNEMTTIWMKFVAAAAMFGAWAWLIYLRMAPPDDFVLFIKGGLMALLYHNAITTPYRAGDNQLSSPKDVTQ